MLYESQRLLHKIYMNANKNLYNGEIILYAKILQVSLLRKTKLANILLNNQPDVLPT